MSSSHARQQANDLLALLRRERDALAEFLVALAAFDRDRAAIAIPAPAPATAAGRLADRVHANSEPATHQGSDARSSEAPRAPTVVEPKTAELSRVHVTVPRRLLEKLAAARDALSRSHPNASDAEASRSASTS